jgi:Anti-sigma factor NepR
MGPMTESRAEKNKTPDTASLDPKAVEAIGRALTAHYVDLVQAPLPDKFAELLARLERADKAPAPQGRGDAID